MYLHKNTCSYPVCVCVCVYLPERQTKDPGLISILLYYAVCYYGNIDPGPTHSFPDPCAAPSVKSPSARFTFAVCQPACQDSSQEATHTHHTPHTHARADTQTEAPLCWSLSKGHSVIALCVVSCKLILCVCVDLSIFTFCEKI